MYFNFQKIITWFQKKGKFSFYILAIFIIFLACISSTFRALTPFASQYRTNFEKIISQMIGHPVHIQSMETGWYRFEPLLKATHVSIEFAKPKQEIKINQVMVGIDLFHSLIHWRIQPGFLLIDGTHLTLEETTKGWKIQNILFSQEDKNEQNILPIILDHHRIQIKNIALDLKPQNLPLFKVPTLNATLINRLGKQFVRGQFSIKEFSSQFIDFGFELSFNPILHKSFYGKGYVSCVDLNLAHPLFPRLFPQIWIEEGKLTAQFWLDFTENQISSVQSKLMVRDVKWGLATLRNKTHFIKRFNGSGSFNQTPQKINIIGSNLIYVDHKGEWPSTSFVMKYNRLNQDFDLSLNKINLEKLNDLDFLPYLPEFSNWLEKLNLKGQLENLHIQRVDQKYQILTQFKNLAFRGFNFWPSVGNISGVLNWTPAYGRLALESQNIWAKFKGSHPIYLEKLNTDVSWSKPQNMLDMNLKYLEAIGHGIQLKAKGVLKNYSTTSLGEVDFQSDFMMKSAEKWLDFLPKKGIKPKLYQWLTKDIYRIGEAKGNLNLQGDLNHFPFDHNQGVFQIETSLKNVSLKYAQGWPVAQNLEGRLSVDKRLLEAQIPYAKIKNTVVGPIRLQIKDLGLDKERLLLHGLSHTEASSAWSILLDSPLVKKIPFLTSLSWQGDIGFDLQLDVPLYPEDNDVLAKGQVHFLGNQLASEDAQLNLVFKDLKGFLNFDQKGFLTSELNMNFLDQKRTPLHIQSTTKNKNREVTIKMGALVSASDLFKIVNQEPSTKIGGSTRLDATLTLAESPLRRQLILQSDLEGLAFDFAPILTKKKTIKVPFKALFDFSTEHMIIDADYQQLLHLKFQDQILNLNSKIPGFKGTLAYHFDEHALQGELQSIKIPKDSSASFSKGMNIDPARIPKFSVKISELFYGDTLLGQVMLQGKANQNELNIEPIVLETPVYRLEGEAKWKKTATKESSDFKFRFEARDIRGVLNQWQINPVLEKGKIFVESKLSWAGALWNGKISTIEGELYTKMTEGRTMNFNKQTESKIGIAKLLSLFSLQTIPRRLKLDFSDLSNDGYSFDEFTGFFKMGKGILHTTTSKIDGPVASAEIKGDIDLTKEEYDLSIRISPHVTSSLPIVAAIAGGPVAGPIAGIATWAASKLLNRGVQKIVAYTYSVKGPWKDPVIESTKVHQIKANQEQEILQKKEE